MYDDDFYAEEGRVARESAQVVVPWLLEEKFPDWMPCVIDIGCGTGEWARTFTENDCWAMGVDNHVPIDQAVVGILRVDLEDGYDCIGYDLAVCLEVAEHLLPESGEPLVAGLARADAVLFSAATPGQPGIGHINCQPHDYWHRLFAEHGMTPTHIGPLFDEPVADFYRRNMFLYEHS